MDTDTESATPRASEPAEGINCFGCAPTNLIGLQLVVGKRDRIFESRFALNANYESYPGVIHGGIVATVVDELMSQAVYKDCGASVYTVGLRVRYGQPMQTDTTHLAVAEVTDIDDVTISASGHIENEAGDLVAAATGTFYRISDRELARLRSRISGLQTAAAGAASAPTSTRK